MPPQNQTNGLEPEFQVEGRIVYLAELHSSSKPKTIRHSRSFVVARKGRQWKIRTTNLRADDVVEGIEYDEAGCDGAQVRELKNYDANVSKIAHENARSISCCRSDKSLPPVTAQARVRHGSEPAGFDTDFIYPLWIAFCSAHYLLSRQDNRIVAPLFITPDCLLSNIPPTLALPAKWKLNESNFVGKILWQSEGKELGVAADGVLKLHDLPPPLNRGFLRASFETTGWLDYNGMKLPGAFIVKIFFPNQTTRKLEVSYTIEAKVRAVYQLRDFSFFPKLSKLTRITDTRYRLSKRCGSYPTYASMTWLSNDEIDAKCKELGNDYEGYTP